MRSHQFYRTFLFSIILLSVTACSSYEELLVDNKIFFPDESSGYIFSDKQGQLKSEPGPGRQKSFRIHSERYLSKGKGFTPESEILNEGIKELLKGNYFEAEILFKDIQENITDGTVENNLAVIYELTKRDKDSMEMYYRALFKSPENNKFRSNLLSFINHTKFTSDTKINSKPGTINVKR